MEIKTWIFHLISTDNLVKWKLLTFASLSETGKFYVFLFSCSSCAWTFSFIHVVKLLRVFLVCIRLHHKRVFHVLGVFIWILNDKNKDEWNIFDKFSFDLLGKVFLFPKCFFLTRENCNKKFSLKKKKKLCIVYSQRSIRHEYLLFFRLPEKLCHKSSWNSFQFVKSR